jgi:hypothetical protein
LGDSEADEWKRWEMACTPLHAIFYWMVVHNKVEQSFAKTEIYGIIEWNQTTGFLLFVKDEACLLGGFLHI